MGVLVHDNGWGLGSHDETEVCAVSEQLNATRNDTMEETESLFNEKQVFNDGIQLPGLDHQVRRGVNKLPRQTTEAPLGEPTR